MFNYTRITYRIDFADKIPYFYRSLIYFHLLLREIEVQKNSLIIDGNKYLVFSFGPPYVEREYIVQSLYVDSKIVEKGYLGHLFYALGMQFLPMFGHSPYSLVRFVNIDKRMPSFKQYGVIQCDFGLSVVNTPVTLHFPHSDSDKKKGHLPIWSSRSMERVLNKFMELVGKYVSA